MRNVVCVVLPTYNEVDNIKKILLEVFFCFEYIQDFELQILVVDDNSPDGTGEIVKSMMGTYENLHLLTGKKRGLGYAYKRGISYCLQHLKADIIIQMDADFQHDPELLHVLLKNYGLGFPVVIGSRFISGGSTPCFPVFRRMLSIFGNVLIRKLCRLHGGPCDCTSGFRCIDAELIRACDHEKLPGRGYSFTTSLLVELLRNGAIVKEIPITFHRREYSTSKLAVFDLVEFLVTLARLAIRQYGCNVQHLIQRKVQP
ncbi:polyprenol monophosphomannose synthase [Desulfogranum japonicum]|uniref:polyprenol monophosphomannose synthase n=1 Tax=Desulfogranum japonicum TaxID=231447 RepID=UPI00041A6204|nr:polyprenol monophosphomannose synthase [Desulfogranum japonicum]